jgi:hypothetical protein
VEAQKGAARMNNSPFEHRKCAICGRRWIMQCRDDEWGYGSRDSLKPWKENKLILFCSRPCMDEYTRRMRDERIRRLKKTTSFRVWWLYEQEYKPKGYIAKRFGMTEKAVEAMVRDTENKHWKDLDWLIANG